MCLATFTPKQDLRRWLRDELKEWAGAHDEDLKRRDVLSATPAAIRDKVQGVRGAARVLAEAADRCYAEDEKADTVELLGALYAGIAPLVYDLREEVAAAPLQSSSGVEPGVAPALTST